MSRKGFTDAERAQCVIWMTEGYGETAVERIFRGDNSKMPTARSIIRLWWTDYQQRGTHMHKGGNEHPQRSPQTKNRIRQLFDGDPQMSLRAAAVETSVAHAAIWNFLRKELGRFPYRLQMAASLTEDRKIGRKSFIQYFRREHRNYARYLEKIAFSNEFKFSLSGSIN